MATSDPEAGDRRDERVSDLIRSLVSDVGLLFRKETLLAKIEMQGKLRGTAVASAFLTAGVLIAVAAFLTLIAAAVLGLAIVVPPWAAASIVGAVLLCLALSLLLTGRAKLRRAVPPFPTNTLEAAEEDVRWIRTQRDHRKTLE